MARIGPGREFGPTRAYTPNEMKLRGPGRPRESAEVCIDGPRYVENGPKWVGKMGPEGAKWLGYSNTTTMLKHLDNDDS